MTSPKRSRGKEEPPEGFGESPEHPHELRLDLPAAHSAGRMGRQVLRRFAQREGIPEDELETLEFVADELLTNAVDHGGGNAAMEESDLTREVRMTLLLTVRQGGWELRVADQGGGNPQEVQRLFGAEEAPDLDDERGRGFFLVSHLVDRLTVERSHDGLGLVFVAVKSYVHGS